MEKRTKPKLRKLSITRRLARNEAKRVFADGLRDWIKRRADRLAQLMTSEIGASTIFIAAVCESEAQAELCAIAWRMFGQQVTEEETVTLIKAVYGQISEEIREGLTLPEPDLLLSWLWARR